MITLVVLCLRGLSLITSVPEMDIVGMDRRAHSPLRDGCLSENGRCPCRGKRQRSGLFDLPLLTITVTAR